MASVFVRGVIGILAAVASLSPSFACGGVETWLTEEEIAIAKAGGSVPSRRFGYTDVTLPDVAFEFPVVGENAVEADTIVDAQSQLFAAADQPLDAPPHVLPQEMGRVAPMPTQERELASPHDERSSLKRVVIACGGDVLVSPNVL